MYKNIEVVIKNYSGLSTETKPTAAGGSAIPNGSRWREVDTGNTYHYDVSTDKWYQTGMTDVQVSDGTKVADTTGQEILFDILRELKKMNLHFAMITDTMIENTEVE